MEHEAALRGGNGEGSVAAGLEVAVGETNGRLGEEGDVVVDEGVDVKRVDGVFGAVVVDGGIAEGVGTAVVEGDGHIGFVEAVVGIEQGEGDACFLVGEQEDFVEGLVETFFVGQ